MEINLYQVADDQGNGEGFMYETYKEAKQAAIDEDAIGVVEHSYEWVDSSLINDWRETSE